MTPSQILGRVKSFLRDVFAPRVYVYKRGLEGKDFPEKEWQAMWKKHGEMFEAMSDMFKKL